MFLCMGHMQKLHYLAAKSGAALSVCEYTPCTEGHALARQLHVGGNMLILWGVRQDGLILEQKTYAPAG